jgi:hypothetical protein
MPLQKSITREHRIYLALWRKALNDEKWDGIINCSSRQMAISMRQGMYRAIRPFRIGEMNDMELQTAAEKFVIVLHQDKAAGTGFLEIKPRLTLAALDAMFDTLGIDEEDLLLGDERRANLDLQKLLEEEPETRSTPFYTRGE